MSLTVVHVDAASVEHDTRVLLEAAEGVDDVTMRQALLQIVAGLSTGVVVAAPDESVSPKVAGQMLGVSRQLVDRMIKDGQLSSTTKPGSSHKLIRVSDVLALDETRRVRHAAVDDLIGGLLDDGDEY